MKRPLFCGCICLIAFLAAWTYLFDAPPFYADIPAKEGEPVTIAGQIYQKEYRSYYGAEKTILSLKSLSLIDQDTGQVSKLDSNYNIICELGSGSTVPELGRKVVVSGEWKLYEHATNPGEFDLADYYAIQGIVGSMEKAVVLKTGERYWRIRESLFRFRNTLKDRIYQALPEKEASILAKMLLGESTGLDADIKELYQRNGIVHILSISGLHITMIGMSVYKLLRRLGCPVNASAVTGAIFLIGYGAMTGFGISACRAIGMYLIHMIGEIAGRSYDLLTAVSVMMAVMLCDNPRLIYHCGFLLSFGSVCGIGCFYPVFALPSGTDRSLEGESRIRRFLQKKGRGIINSLLVSICISLFTMPIMLHFFYEVPVYSPFVNLLILPFMGTVMGIGILLMALPSFPFLAEAETVILGYYEEICLLFEELPFHTWRVGRPQLWQIGVYYLGIVGMILLHERVCRGLLLKCAAAGLFLTLLSADFFRETAVSFLHVGQGDCMIVCTEDGRTYLFDGGSSSKKTVGEDIILPFLKYHGISVIDGVFISHPDTDHMNGVTELLQMKDSIQVRKIYLPDIAQEYREDFEEIYAAAEEVKVAYLSAGDALITDELQITCLHPPQGYEGDTNAYSLCFLLQSGDLSVLLTGDVEAGGERVLTQELQDRGIRQVNVLKVAHHGSRNSTGEEFLEGLNADLAVISCGEGNSYGHPHEETIQRLTKAGISCCQTFKQGCITVTESGYQHFVKH